MAKSEKEKMLAGELYIADDPVLLAERKRAARLCRLINATTEDDLDQRQKLLKELIPNSGKSPQINPPFYCDYGSNITLGDHVFMNFGCVILDCNTVTLGSNVLLAPYVQIYSATHPTDPAVRDTWQELGLPITIGDQVWIGGGAIICPGVTIGSNTTIGAGSVVTKDVPDNVVAAGNPCRVIRTC